MKYLRPFNESYNYRSIKYDIEDMLLELSDDGYEVDVIHLFNSKSFELFINQNESIVRKDKRIIDIIDRVIKYMNDLGFSDKITVALITVGVYNVIESIDDLFNEGVFSSINITFNYRN